MKIDFFKKIQKGMMRRKEQDALDTSARDWKLLLLFLVVGSIASAWFHWELYGGVVGGSFGSGGEAPQEEAEILLNEPQLDTVLSLFEERAKNFESIRELDGVDLSL